MGKYRLDSMLHSLDGFTVSLVSKGGIYTSRFVPIALLKRFNPLVLIVIVAILATLAGFFVLKQSGRSEFSDVIFKDYSKQILADKLYNSVKTLSASDNSRISGFEGESNAASYIQEQFKSIGLEISEQSFPVQSYVSLSMKITLSIENESMKVLTDARVLSFSSPTPPEGISSDVIMVGVGAQSDYSGLDVNGKFVLIQRGGELFRTKVARASQLGAVGAIFYDPNSDNTISATLGELSDIPAVCISRKDAEAILTAISKNTLTSMSVTLDSICKDSTSKNVIGTLKASGNTTGKCLVIGAHYDGVDTPAANDNASGIALLIEAARVMSLQKEPLSCDIKFVAFGAEEIGLLGSIAFVQKMTYDEIDATIAMLNFDMVGVGDTITAGSSTISGHSKLLQMSSEAMKQLSFKYETSETDNSDHVPFAYAKIPAVFFQNGPYEDYHTDKDILSVIDKDALLKVCNLAVSLSTEIARNPELIKK